MKRKMHPQSPISVRTRHTSSSGYCSVGENSTLERAGGLPLKSELVELCTEIAGALLRGYCDGRRGGDVRQVITRRVKDKMACSSQQAASLVDLALELIHLQAYGTFRRNELELSLLVARGGGEVNDLKDN